MDLTTLDPPINTSVPFKLPDIIYISPFSLHLWLTFSTGLCIFGSLTYLLLLSILLHQRNIHKTTTKGGTLLVFHLIILELINTMGYLSFFIITTYIAQSGLILNEWVCRIGQLLFLSTVVVGNWVAVILAMNRFVAIVFPHCYKSWMASKVWYWAVVGCWGMALACYVPMFMGVGGVLGAVPPLGTCGMFPFPGWRYHFSVGFGTPVPMFLIFSFYGLIYCKMVWNFAEKRNSPTAESTALRRESTTARLLMVRYRTVKMLCISALWHCVCHVPLPIMVEYMPLFYRDPLVHLWIRTMFFCGYAFNPVIIYFLGHFLGSNSHFVRYERKLPKVSNGETVDSRYLHRFRPERYDGPETVNRRLNGTPEQQE